MCWLNPDLGPYGRAPFRWTCGVVALWRAHINLAFELEGNEFGVTSGKSGDTDSKRAGVDPT